MEDNLKGGFRLVPGVIDREIPPLLVGNYLLSEGLRSQDQRLIVTYVGRSNDLNRRLKEHLLDKEHYVWFWYKVAESEYASYIQECYDYHLYQNIHALNNEVHPSKLDQSEVCPICHK